MTAQRSIISPRVERYVAAMHDERQASDLAALVTLALLGASLLVIAAVIS
jgi:hypothetical protein